MTFVIAYLLVIDNFHSITCINVIECLTLSELSSKIVRTTFIAIFFTNYTKFDLKKMKCRSSALRAENYQLSSKSNWHNPNMHMLTCTKRRPIKSII